MMSNPEQIRADIEVTRDELGRDVDALADKVSPPKIIERKKTRMRQMLGDVKGRVMGVADDVGGSASSTGHAVGDKLGAAGDAVKDLPHKARQSAQGTPLVAGLVTAGLGFLIASLIPATDAERRLSTQLRDQAQPFVDKAVDKAKGAAQEVAQNLKEPAKDAVQEVKESATASAETVKDEAQHTATRVKENVGGGGSSGSQTPTTQYPTGQGLG